MSAFEGDRFSWDLSAGNDELLDAFPGLLSDLAAQVEAFGPVPNEGYVPGYWRHAGGRASYEGGFDFNHPPVERGDATLSRHWDDTGYTTAAAETRARIERALWSADSLYRDYTVPGTTLSEKIQAGTTGGEYPLPPATPTSESSRHDHKIDFGDLLSRLHPGQSADGTQVDEQLPQENGEQ